MSVLETPRFVFRGRVTWDPIVTNNLPAQYDENSSETVFDPGESVTAFRTAAIARVGAGGNWNPHGTHRSAFYETTIVGVDTGSGPSVTDPLVGCPVSFLGMLVDLEPYGAFSSQLFFDTMSFGIPGGYRIDANRSSRFTARYINFARNKGYKYIAGVASVVWQTSFAKTDGLRVDPHDSPALLAMAKALQDDGVLGLTVRWNAYRTLYYDSENPADNAKLAEKLHDKLTGGGFQPNPARSEIVGVLGLWRKGEPACEPGDRALLTRVPGTIASAHARLTANELTLDLANSVPEIGVDLTKKNLGDLTAVAVAPDGMTVVATLGSIDYGFYNRETYDRTGGIVTIQVDSAKAAQAESTDIQLRQADGTVLLAETALRAIPVEPNQYLDEGDSNSIHVLVLDRGRPTSTPVQVTLATVDSTTPTTATQFTGPDGVAEFPVTGAKGQVESFVLMPGLNPSVPSEIDPQTTTYLYLRTLPADAAMAGLDPTWANVYANVLRNWHAMAPCMDNWLRLGDPAQVKAYAVLVKRLTDKSNFESFRFMPVTRDLTAGQRTLLYNFLDGAKPAIAAMTTSTAVTPSRLTFGRLSRSLRGG